jgi:hypothetical protein
MEGGGMKLEHAVNPRERTASSCRRSVSRGKALPRPRRLRALCRLGKEPFARPCNCKTELAIDERSVFDITGDCEDGAPAGREAEHAGMIADLLLDPANRHGRLRRTHP